MQSKTFTDIEIANKIMGQYYQLKAIEAGGDILLIVGDDGRPTYFRVEIRFHRLGYINCPAFFTNEFQFRLATKQEAPSIREFLNAPEATIYCIERGVSFGYPISGDPPVERKPYKFFIVAQFVEIAVYYDGNLDVLLRQHNID